jgi:hypothetical protein
LKEADLEGSVGRASGGHLGKSPVSSDSQQRTHFQHVSTIPSNGGREDSMTEASSANGEVPTIGPYIISPNAQTPTAQQKKGGVIFQVSYL